MPSSSQRLLGPSFSSVDSIKLEIGYDVWLALVFFLGMGVLYYLFQIVSKINALLKTDEPIAKSKGETAKSSQALAAAALGIVKAGRQSHSEGLHKFNTHIKDNKYNARMDPFEILNRIEKSGTRADITTYNSLLDACISSKNFEKAYQLFTEMKETASLSGPDVVTYNIYIKGIIEAINSGEHIDLGMVADLLAEMQARDIRPNVITFNTVLDLCVLTSHIDLAWSYFDEMQGKYSLSPDAYTFSIMLKGVKACPRRPHFFEYIFGLLYSFIAKTPSPPDEVLVNSAIDACGKHKDLQKLDSVLALCRDKAGRKGLSLGTYGRLVALYGQLKLVRKVEEVHREIMGCGLELNDITFGCILDAYLRCERPELVAEVYTQTLANPKADPKKVFNVVVYTTLVRAFGRLRNFSGVSDVCKRMRADPRVQLNLIAYNAMLDACVRCEEYEEMERVFADMVERGKVCPELAPDLITYSTLIKGMCKSRNVSKALCLYEEIKRKGIELDEVMFNSLLDGMVNCPDSIAKTEIILADMKAHKVACSNYTYSILVKIYARAKDATKALDVYAEMKRNGVSPGVVVYTCLLQVCIKYKMIDRAVELYQDMRRSGVVPDHVAYNTIINGCSYAGRLQSACEIVYEAMTNNVRLADEIYNTLLKGLLMNKKMSMGQKHTYATNICNYVSLNKVRVSQDYYTQVMNTLVFQQPGTEGGGSVGYPGYADSLEQDQEQQQQNYYDYGAAGYYYAYPAQQYMGAYYDYEGPEYAGSGKKQ